MLNRYNNTDGNVSIQVKLRNFEQMTSYDESLGPHVNWRLLFAFVFVECLNTYISFIFFTNILVL